MKGACPKVPRQMNFSDCGLFTLQFAQLFFRQPLKDFRFPIRTLGHWFTQDVVRCKRESIAKLIRSLMDQYRPGHGITLPQIHFNSLAKDPPPPLRKTQEEDETCSGVLSPSPPPFLESQAPDSIPGPGSPKRIKIKLCERAALPPRPKSPMPFLETSDSLLVISDDDSGNHSDVDNKLQSFSSTSKCSIYQKKYSTSSSSSVFSCNSAFKPTSAAARSYPVSNNCSENSEREPFQFFLPDLSLSGGDESPLLSSDSQNNNKLRRTILNRKITR
ncbi:UNVERIFIED_CONTAM: hypothetical protein GTU68_052310 [Idotea baltica]|nr:hypothetical protein [Idotea baltica]